MGDDVQSPSSHSTSPGWNWNRRFSAPLRNSGFALRSLSPQMPRRSRSSDRLSSRAEDFEHLTSHEAQSLDEIVSGHRIVSASVAELEEHRTVERVFEPRMDAATRATHLEHWRKAVGRALDWAAGTD